MIYENVIDIAEICNRGEKLNFAVYHCTGGCAFERCALDFQALEP